MKIDKIINKIDKSISIIKPCKQIIEHKNLYFNFLKKAEPEVRDFFIQIKKNNNFEGLMVEAIVIGQEQIYDIVFGNENTENVVIKFKNISRVSISTIPSTSFVLDSEKKKTKNTEFSVRLNIESDSFSAIFYETLPERYNELLRVYSVILNLI